MAPLELVGGGLGPEEDSPGDAMDGRRPCRQAEDVPPACPQVVRMGECESSRAGGTELLQLGKPIQKGRQDPLCGGKGRDRATG